MLDHATMYYRHLYILAHTVPDRNGFPFKYEDNHEINPIACLSLNETSIFHNNFIKLHNDSL
jgi:hypothetical protein